MFVYKPLEETRKDKKFRLPSYGPYRVTDVTETGMSVIAIAVRGQTYFGASGKKTSNCNGFYLHGELVLNCCEMGKCRNWEETTCNSHIGMPTKSSLLHRNSSLISIVHKMRNCGMTP